MVTGAASIHLARGKKQSGRCLQFFGIAARKENQQVIELVTKEMNERINRQHPEPFSVLNMKTNYYLFLFAKNLAFLIVLAFCISCSKVQEAQGGFQVTNSDRDMKANLAQSIKNLSPEQEFKENKIANKICFYSFGSLAYGYKIPGITEDDKKIFIEEISTPVINRFSDDPEPVFSSEAYWTAVVEFLEKYNGLVVKHLTEEKRRTP